MVIIVIIPIISQFQSFGFLTVLFKNNCPKISQMQLQDFVDMIYGIAHDLANF